MWREQLAASRHTLQPVMEKVFGPAGGWVCSLPALLSSNMRQVRKTEGFTLTRNKIRVNLVPPSKTQQSQRAHLSLIQIHHNYLLHNDESYKT